jgi:DNA-directed RNA polymerase subunit RPC12/RpoP
MQPAIYCVPGKQAGRLVVILALLLLPAGLLFAPLPGHSQNVPPVGNPTIVGTFCPKCKQYIDMPTGKRPSSCPHCGFSFVQRAQPKTMPKLKPINPFGNSVFTNPSVTADNGKLQTVHFDNDGLAAKAEAWGKEMKQVDDQSRQKQEAQAQEFERKKQEALKGRGDGHALGQLKNIYADDNAWNGDSSVVDLRGKTKPTPKLLATGTAGSAAGSPIGGGSSEYDRIREVSDQAQYSHMTPGELDALARQYPDNPEIQQTITSLKARIKSTDNLGNLFDQASANKDVMDSQYKQAGVSARESASTILSLTAEVPDGLISAAAGDKTWAEWAGVDAGPFYVQNGVQDKLTTTVDNIKMGNSTEAFLNSEVKVPRFKEPMAVGGAKGAVGALAAVPDLISIYKNTDKAATSLVEAKELNAQLDAYGVSTAANKWSTMHNDTVDTSAKLYRLIQEANQGTKAP